jgi:hypothetical protein
VPDSSKNAPLNLNNVFKSTKQWLKRTWIIMLPITIAISLTGCSDPYEACMKEEKRKNAYLGEADYIKQSSQFCARKARQSK